MHSGGGSTFCLFVTKKLAEKACLKYPDRFRRKIDPMNSEYLAEVLRIDMFPNNKFGIAADLKMTVNMSSNFRPGSRV